MTMVTSQFQPGALVRARERDWIVLPPDEEGVIRLRPVDGNEDEATGIFLALERNALEQSKYPPPTPANIGDISGSLLLRDAVRLSLRNGAGFFRSMGHVSITPRPYQFVPLIMALKLDTIRLLIADDVGIGKTIEAALIARELLDREIIRRIGVLCPPHLCDQWETELRNKFNIEATVVQPSRIARLEREIPRNDINLYQYYRHLIVSIDYIKSDRNRGVFLDNLPDLIIVDEAHTATRPKGQIDSGQQKRYALIKAISEGPNQHILLVTATPHSGIEESFRSLLGLINPAFDQPDDINVTNAKLLPHIIQRKRTDLEKWMGDDTPFPRRESSESSYTMSPEYLKLFNEVLAYCRESVAIEGGTGQQQRVRYWAAIAILRCILSSPKAAEAMLNRRYKPNKNQPLKKKLLMKNLIKLRCWIQPRRKSLLTISHPRPWMRLR